MNTISLISFRSVALWILTCQLFTIQACAQWSTDPGVNNIITADTNQQSACRITSDGSGGAIIAWMRLLLLYEDRQ